MYIVGTLKKVKCTSVLDVAFRARSRLEPPTLLVLKLIVNIFSTEYLWNYLVNAFEDSFNIQLVGGN